MHQVGVRPGGAAIWLSSCTPRRARRGDAAVARPGRLLGRPLGPDLFSQSVSSPRGESDQAALSAMSVFLSGSYSPDVVHSDRSRTWRLSCPKGRARGSDRIRGVWTVAAGLASWTRNPGARRRPLEEKSGVRSLNLTCYRFVPGFDEIVSLISGLLTSIGKTFLEALVYKGPRKLAAKICVNSRCNKFYQK